MSITSVYRIKTELVFCNSTLTVTHDISNTIWIHLVSSHTCHFQIKKYTEQIYSRASTLSWEFCEAKLKQPEERCCLKQQEAVHAAVTEKPLYLLTLPREGLQISIVV